MHPLWMLDGGRSSFSTASVCTYSQKGIKTTVRVVIHLETSCVLMGPSWASPTLCRDYQRRQMRQLRDNKALEFLFLSESAHGAKNTETSSNTQWLTTVTSINVAVLSYYINQQPYHSYLLLLNVNVKERCCCSSKINGSVDAAVSEWCFGQNC